ncbi:Thiamine biosynthesis lipoprotein ApbE precursor [Roseivivax sp. THAF40]|uniref:FAD:protein FMN transferase n=1 Tax=unclassified Roseivivax TaxID=2639302 RepID=UPI001268038A|nr:MULTISPECIES: FAD:protein FMN transferase [unclassified Roseivivax]QFS81371.1 Thiamine biosynthesis lipoprotein ApbE precursor [Roseivivax sp. THAF197b]QFT45100.1 Thiamine biosynthesis lipoprotein ApbE precursor [Roseivivax sp. THAF40]
MRRRRFLTLAAAFACAPRLSQAATWSGIALGAEVSVTLRGPRDEVHAALRDIPVILDRVEAAFSIYRENSEVSILNRTGRLIPSAVFRDLVAEVDRAHALTDGLFDPTVQPLWRALAAGGDLAAARDLIGWDRVRRGDEIILGSGQALTFNGIAQGYATDLVRDHLKARGASEALVNIGEFQALGGPFRLGLTDPDAGHLGQRSLQDGAIATSSPGAMRLGTGGHILSPDGRAPLWSTLSVEAPRATLADALSTAGVFMDLDALRDLKAGAGLSRITCVAQNGDLRTI